MLFLIKGILEAIITITLGFIIENIIKKINKKTKINAKISNLKWLFHGLHNIKIKKLLKCS